MKSFFQTFIVLVALVVLFPSHSHAALYPLKAEGGATTITVTMSGAPADQSKYKLFDGQLAVYESGSSTPWVQQASSGTVVWKLTGLNLVLGKTYSFQVKKVPANTVVSETTRFDYTVSALPSGTLLKSFSISPGSSQAVVVSGTLDKALYENTSNLRIDFYWSKTHNANNEPTDASKHTAGIGGETAIAADGSYTITVSDLTPSYTYYFKQTISENGSNTPLESKTGIFTADKGFLVPGSKGEQDDFNARSYHLLAPWPGLSVLLDPDLCAQQKEQGKLPPNAVCDVNGFLNFAFKLLIGLTAVVLVLRLMYEGYQYVVTDVPFLKASAKSGFFTALMGLLLALSSYLILNTINPKLVNNTISIDGVNVGVEQFTFNDANETYTTKNGVKTKISSIKLKEIYQSAKTVSQKTGVKISTILGILWVETHFNTGVGGCYWDDAGVLPPVSVRDDIGAYQRITASIPTGLRDHKVSCAVAGVGYGGGMGASQHIPTSWEGLAAQIKAASGKTFADPWDLQDALYALAVHMKQSDGINDPQNAACKYYSGHACGTGAKYKSGPKTGQYANLDYRDKFNSAVAAIEAEVVKENLN